MSRYGRAVLMVGMGVIVARLIITGGFGWFVQQHMRIPLILATVVLLAFGFYEAVSSAQDANTDEPKIDDSDDHDHDHGHRHDHDHDQRHRLSAGPVVGWLLVLPLVVLISVAPTGLGAAAADRVDAYTPEDTNDEYAPLDDSAGPVVMRVFDFLDRALWDENGTLDDVTVRLEGLVVNDDDVPDGFRLVRFMVSCCAADGVPLQVILSSTAPPLPDDTWVEVDVRWRAPEVPYDQQDGAPRVEADVVGITVVPNPPDDPYESPY
jgi:uncharacterized repeat protein (TIGR03943 family)